MEKNMKESGVVKKLSLSTIAFILAAIMLFGGVVGATLAWLMDKTRTIENTFTLGNINLFSLEEPGLDESTNSQVLDLYVDQKIVKNPYLTVGAYTVPCYVYVKIDTSENFADYVDVTFNGGYVNTIWTQLERPDGTKVDGVYYLVHQKTDENVNYQILKGWTDGTNSLDQPYAKGMLKAKSVFPEDAGYYTDDKRPTISFTGYAVQEKNIGTAYDGWLALVAEYPNNT